MNKKQWHTLSILSMVIMVIFIRIDLVNNSCLDLALEYTTSTIGIYDVWCIINSEMYEPFIYLSFMLSGVFLILGLLESKENKNG